MKFKFIVTRQSHSHSCIAFCVSILTAHLAPNSNGSHFWVSVIFTGWEINGG